MYCIYMYMYIHNADLCMCMDFEFVEVSTKIVCLTKCVFAGEEF